jgi:hypothetical protein
MLKQKHPIKFSVLINRRFWSNENELYIQKLYDHVARIHRLTAYNVINFDNTWFFFNAKWAIIFI